jgi:hypothetical protein
VACYDPEKLERLFKFADVDETDVLRFLLGIGFRNGESAHVETNHTRQAASAQADVVLPTICGRRDPCSKNPVRSAGLWLRFACELQAGRLKICPFCFVPFAIPGANGQASVTTLILGVARWPLLANGHLAFGRHEGCGATR